ncbi:MAG: hypothetical protein H7210_02460 [Pyrinomonadaceae bacterium]|nr:hypothetical protein [Phycisphaerales bacterium]
MLPLGCASDPNDGYAFTSAHDSGITSVYVPTFRNNTYTHGIEVDLTDAIIKEIKATTPWRVASESDAQTMLTGSIVDARIQPLSLGRNTGLVQEQAVTMVIQFDFKDVRTGKMLTSRRNFSSTEAFVPAYGVQERLEVGQHATVQDLARSVVAELRSGW